MFFSSRPVVCDDSGISGTVQVVVLPRRLQVEIRLAALAHEGHGDLRKAEAAMACFDSKTTAGPCCG